ncbi:unnamed protein product [Dovyalis caffra]|uniref:TF-B3 domain-containing protein n=1 Tax=Dovyalis caffra TaxID=77055 RepID=A0AAV1R8L1_9ROSI|nr:unnamed protein product [Dovyalis caffra]
MARRRKVGSDRRYHLRSRTMVETPLWHFFKIILPSTLEDQKLKIGAFDQYVGVEESNERQNASAEKDVGMKKCQGSVAGHESCNFELFSDKRGKKPMKEEYLPLTDFEGANELRKGKFNRHQMSSRNGSLFNVFSETKVDRSKRKTECDEGELLSKCEEHMEIVVSGLSKASQASKRAIHTARKFKPKNPSFMVLLRPYNIHNNFVYVPLGFAEKYLNQVSERIKLLVSDGKEWPLRVIKCERKLSKGWNRFHKENDWKEGDVCVCELIKSKKSVLKVTIFRLDEDSESLN